MFFVGKANRCVVNGVLGVNSPVLSVATKSPPTSSPSTAALPTWWSHHCIWFLNSCKSKTVLPLFKNVSHRFDGSSPMRGLNHRLCCGDSQVSFDGGKTLRICLGHPAHTKLQGGNKTKLVQKPAVWQAEVGRTLLKSGETKAEPQFRLAPAWLQRLQPGTGTTSLNLVGSKYR